LNAGNILYFALSGCYRNMYTYQNLSNSTLKMHAFLFLNYVKGIDFQKIMTRSYNVINTVKKQAHSVPKGVKSQCLRLGLKCGRNWVDRKGEEAEAARHVPDSQEGSQWWAPRMAQEEGEGGHHRKN
jgi:hypothetical protein